MGDSASIETSAAVLICFFIPTPSTQQFAEIGRS
jgi:hypothetical protein